MQIGEVADRTGLSLRTIRYYEEVGLIRPTARTAGGFRLYSEGDVARLSVIMRMKPLDFTLDEMRQLLDVLDGLAQQPATAERAGLVVQLEQFHQAAAERVAAARTRLRIAEGFAQELAEQVAGQREPDSRPSG